MTAAIYARKSTDQSGVGEDAKSVTRQIDHARSFAEEKGWVVDDAHIYVDDGISGAEFAKRPSFVRLMNALKPRPAFHVLIMSEESRLGRESIETGYAFKQIIGAGVEVWLYLEKRQRTLDSAVDKIMLSLSGFADELEREKARHRTHDAMLRKAKAGHVTGGRVFGYQNVEVLGQSVEGGAAGPRLHVARRIKEDEASVVRQIFAGYAAGLGLSGLVKQLNEAGAPTPRSQQGRPRGWAPSSVRSVLLRPLYRGEIVWNRTRKRTAQGTIRQHARPEADRVTVDAPELRIVSDDLWFAVQRRFEARGHDSSSKGRPRGSGAKYLLTGLLRCPCGSSFEALSRPHGNRRAFVYGCAAHRRRGRHVCPNDLVVPMEIADNAVLDVVEQFMLAPLVVEKAVERAVRTIAGEGRGERVTALGRDITEKGQELQRLVDALAVGGESQTLMVAIRGREAQLASLRSELSSVQTSAIDFDRGKLKRELLARTKDWKALLRAAPESGQRALRALIIDRLTFSPEEGETGRYYAFSGAGTIEPLLCGLVVQKVASPPGTNNLYTIPLKTRAG